MAVEGGRLYTMDRQQQPAEVERVMAWDADTGETLWEHAYAVQYGNLSYGSGPRATPTVFEGRVYTLGAMGHLHCLDAADGKPLWSKHLVADFGAVLPEWGLAASPVIWQDLVIVHPGAKPTGCFMAFNRLSGKEAWRASADPAGYATPVIIRQGKAEQLIGWTPEHVLGLDPSNGKILWETPYKVTYGVSIATPIFRGGIVFVTGYWEGSKAIRLGKKPTDAELIWEDDETLRGLMAQPLYQNGHVYCLDKSLGLTCFELASGTKLWEDGHRMTPRGRNPHASLVWLGDADRAIILNSEGELILARLNPRGYHEESRTNIISAAENPVWAHPAFAGSRAYARNETQIVCVPLIADEAQ